MNWINRINLRRITRDGRYLAEIDGLRFLAIAAVVFYHIMEEPVYRVNRESIPYPDSYFFQQTIALISNGSRGVYLFFVISGMILALPFARYYLAEGSKVSLKKY